MLRWAGHRVRADPQTFFSYILPRTTYEHKYSIITTIIKQTTEDVDALVLDMAHLR